MANVIKLKRGTSTPTTSDIVDGEVAIDKSAKKFFLNDGGTIKEIGGIPDSSVTSAKIADGAIVNADINASAAIAGSKISPAFTSDITGTGNLTLTSTDAGSSAAPELELYRNSSSPADADYLGQLKFTGESDDGSKEVYAKITGKISDASSGTEDGIIEVAHRKAGSNVITARFTSTAFKLINGTELEAEGGATITGTCTATTFSGSGASLTNLPSGQLTGALPAIDGSNLTGISGGLDSDAQFNTVGGTNAGDSFTGTDATNNTLIGYDAGTAITSGDGNTFLGANAGKTNTTGYDNVAIGLNALKLNTDGANHIAIGKGALDANTTGESCVGIGSLALSSNTTASNNIGIGELALYLNTTGTNNTAVGHNALKANTTANYSTAVGATALDSLTTGNNNTALGYAALTSVTTSVQNVAVGAYALNNNTGTKNVATGTSALFSNTSGELNSSFGHQAGRDITEGDYNTILGANAGNSGTNDLTTGSNNILIGYNSAASSATVDNEITLGNANITKLRVPGTNLESTDGILSLKTGSGSPTAIRFYCEVNNAHYVNLRAPAHSSFSGNPDFILPPNEGTNGYFLKTDGSGNTSWAEASGLTSDAQNNTVGGTNAGDSFSGTDATNNTLIGFDAGTDITTADNAACFGYKAGANLTTAFNMTALGAEALTTNTTGSFATAVGYRSQASSASSFSSESLGHKALENMTTAAHNCAFGRNSLHGVTTGSNNVAIGYYAGGTGSNKITTGGNNILIGYQATASSSSVSNEITLGDSDITKFRVPGISFEISASAVTNGAAFYENAKTVAADYTLSGSNAMAAGPITINSNVTVTVSSGDTLTIV